MRRRQVSAAMIIPALAAATASAGTVAYDNTDFTFEFAPTYATLAYGFPVVAGDRLFFMATPADNEAGLASGYSLQYDLGRSVVTSSNNVLEYYSTGFGSPSSVSLALADDSGVYDGSGNDPRFYQKIAVFNEGDTIDASSFTAPYTWTSSHGPIGGYAESDGYTKLIGDEAILGFKVDEGAGTRYGFVRLTWFEGVIFDTTPEYQSIAGGPSTYYLDVYLPTAWGYADTLDEGVTVVLPNPCLADLTGDGTANLDDLDAFIAAYLAGC